MLYANKSIVRAIEQGRLLADPPSPQFYDNLADKTRVVENTLLYFSHMPVYGICIEELYEVSPRFA